MPFSHLRFDLEWLFIPQVNMTLLFQDSQIQEFSFDGEANFECGNRKDGPELHLHVALAFKRFEGAMVPMLLPGNEIPPLSEFASLAVCVFFAVNVR
jgi:hypothetical protein